MSKVKDFNIWLATLIYTEKATNEEILYQFNLKYGGEETWNPWLNDQIAAIRNDPSFYRDLASRPTNE